VDSYKTELIADRVWRSRVQLELATVKYVSWFNHERLHETLGDIPPVEFEQHHALALALESRFSGNGSVAGTLSRPADGLRTRRFSRLGVDYAANSLIASRALPLLQAGPAQAATGAGQR
jgi:Integrase core domain